MSAPNTEATSPSVVSETPAVDSEAPPVGSEVPPVSSEVPPVSSEVPPVSSETPPVVSEAPAVVSGISPSVISSEKSDPSVEVEVVVKRRGGRKGLRTTSALTNLDDEDNETSARLQALKASSAPIAAVQPVVVNENRTIGTVYSAGGVVSRPDAFAESEHDTAKDRDTQARLEREGGVEAVRQNKATGTQGPIRAPTFLRATCRFDYQADICKDYKETGFCGFGDSCIFLHDRSDMKSGWKQEQEWEEKQAEKRRRLQALEEINPDADVSTLIKSLQDKNSSTTEETSTEEFPFACHICRESFRDPIVTQCGHYFCQNCALTRCRSNTKCAICNKDTRGIFSKAWKLIRHQQRTASSTQQ